MFIDREFIEKRTKSLVCGNNVTIDKDERTVNLDVYVLTVKGLLFIKKTFSDEYPWLRYIKNIPDNYLFAPHYSFDIIDIETNLISSYLELSVIDTL